ncbi:hypothetical protein CR513_22969, partial [Mucuna pruriens]
MKADDRKRRFNEAIVNMLYPSPPQHEQHQLEPVQPLIQGSRSHVISGTLDDYDNSSTSCNEENDSEAVKLTRAQRKKIRKKKLKEEAIHRGKLIGPLLPLIPTQVAEDAPGVRSNAPEEGDEAACAKTVRVKHRRMTKRLAKEKRNASTSENSNPSSAIGFNEARL